VCLQEQGRYVTKLPADGPLCRSSLVLTVQWCLQDLALTLLVGRADPCPEGPAAGWARQAEGRREKAGLDSSAVLLAEFVSYRVTRY